MSQQLVGLSYTISRIHTAVAESTSIALPPLTTLPLNMGLRLQHIDLICLESQTYGTPHPQYDTAVIQVRRTQKYVPFEGTMYNNHDTPSNTCYMQISLPVINCNITEVPHFL